MENNRVRTSYNYQKTSSYSSKNTKKEKESIKYGKLFKLSRHSIIAI